MFNCLFCDNVLPCVYLLFMYSLQVFNSYIVVWHHAANKFFIQSSVCNILSLAVDYFGFDHSANFYVGGGLIDGWGFFCWPFYILDGLYRFFPLCLSFLPLQYCVGDLCLSLLHFHTLIIFIYHLLPQCPRHPNLFWL